MKMFAKLAAGAALCAVMALPAITVSTPAQARVVVGVSIGPRGAPPPLRVERFGPAPHRGWVWRQGRWDWRNGGWVWVGGVWVAPPRMGAVWVPGHWRSTRRGWVWVEGHWR